MQILTSPDRLGTTTIPAHQGVGSVTGEITPSVFIRCSSFWTFGRRGMGTLRGVNTA